MKYLITVGVGIAAIIAAFLLMDWFVQSSNWILDLGLCVGVLVFGYYTIKKMEGRG